MSGIFVPSVQRTYESEGIHVRNEIRSSSTKRHVSETHLQNPQNANNFMLRR